jgi:hypothetical protein
VEPTFQNLAQDRHKETVEEGFFRVAKAKSAWLKIKEPDFDFSLIERKLNQANNEST